MCGDTNCPSCGPAQGYNLALDAFWDRLLEKFPGIEDLITFPPSNQEEIDLEKMIEWVLEEGIREGLAQAAGVLDQAAEKQSIELELDDLEKAKKLAEELRRDNEEKS